MGGVLGRNLKKVMTKQSFIDNLAKKAATVLKTLSEKGTGYNPTETEGEYDPFYNYSLGAELGGIATEQAMISRMGEKLIRLQNITRNPSAAGNEAISETCKDIVGIGLLVWEYLESLDDEVEIKPEPEELPLVSPTVAPKGSILGDFLQNWTKK